VGGYLRESTRPPTEHHDVALLDLDGVVYLGGEAIPGAIDALTSARRAGMRLAFVTNNAARTPDVVAEHLTKLGIPARTDEVITSAQAAARYLADRLPAGAEVLVVGTTGLVVALRERGLTPIHEAAANVAAIVQGYSPDMNWRLLAEGAVAINRGVPWIATNVDPTVPSRRGPLPGNGSLVAALKHATGRTPVVTGKPEPTMHRESVLRSGAERPLVVGDRLDTDIEGADAVGCPSLLVLTGVTTPGVLLAAPRRMRPTYVGADLGALLAAHPSPRRDGSAMRCGPWRAECAVREGGHVAVTLAGDRPGPVADGPDLDALRALCAATWDALDEAEVSDKATQSLDVTVNGTSDGARAALATLAFS